MARHALREDLLVGGLGGLLATVVMSGWMLAARRLGVERAEQPPERIVEEGLDAAGIRRSERAENVVASISHLAYGAALGVGYRWARRRTRLPGSGLLHGVGWGLGVWVANYAGWIPAAGIMPPPRRDDPGRQATMVVAHLLYGGVLGVIADPTRTRPRFGGVSAGPSIS